MESSISLCNCAYSVLLLNPEKRYSKREIKKSSKRINKIINNCKADLFDNAAKKLAKIAAEVILTNKENTPHDCDETNKTVALIKQQIKRNKMDVIKAGSRNDMALVPYYPGDDKMKELTELEDPPFSTQPCISTNSQIQREFIWNENSMYDEGNSSSSSNESFIELKVPKMKTNSKIDSTVEMDVDTESRTQYCGKRKNRDDMGPSNDSNRDTKVKPKNIIRIEKKSRQSHYKDTDEDINELVNKWVEVNRNPSLIDSEIYKIIGHWYRFQRPKFKCGWTNDKQDTIEDTEKLIKRLKGNATPLKNYLKSITDRSFRTLIQRAPELIININEMESNSTGQQANKDEKIIINMDEE